MILAKDKVISILERIPQTRANDNLLIAYFIKEEYGLQNTFDIALYTNTNLYETIRRTRQKVMEENPNLRPNAVTMNHRQERERRVRDECKGT